MKLAQYSHQCGPRNVCTCGADRRAQNVQSPEGTEPDTKEPNSNGALALGLFWSSKAELHTFLKEQTDFDL